MLIDGIDVKVIGEVDIPFEEAEAYVDRVRKTLGKGETLKEFTITIPDKTSENVELDYNVAPPPFKRIRRITGA